jgi:hypothetical protein
VEIIFAVRPIADRGTTMRGTTMKGEGTRLRAAAQRLAPLGSRESRRLVEEPAHPITGVGNNRLTIARARRAGGGFHRQG